MKRGDLGKYHYLIGIHDFRLRILTTCSGLSFRWASIDRIYPYEGIGYTKVSRALYAMTAIIYSQATLHKIASRKADRPEMPMIVKRASVGKVPNRGGDYLQERHHK